MIYDSSLGIFGNIQRLFKERDRLNERVITNRSEAKHEVLCTESDMVEAVIDEFYSIIGEEPEEENV